MFWRLEEETPFSCFSALTIEDEQELIQQLIAPLLYCMPLKTLQTNQLSSSPISDKTALCLLEKTRNSPYYCQPVKIASSGNTGSLPIFRNETSRRVKIKKLKMYFWTIREVGRGKNCRVFKHINFQSENHKKVQVFLLNSREKFGISQKSKNYSDFWKIRRSHFQQLGDKNGSCEVWKAVPLCMSPLAATAELKNWRRRTAESETSLLAARSMPCLARDEARAKGEGRDTTKERQIYGQKMKRWEQLIERIETMRNGVCRSTENLRNKFCIRIKLLEAHFGDFFKTLNDNR